MSCKHVGRNYGLETCRWAGNKWFVNIWVGTYCWVYVDDSIHSWKPYEFSAIWVFSL